MKLGHLTYFIFNLIPLIDNKEYEKVSFKEMENVFDRKEVFPFLEEKFRDSIDLRIYSNEDKEEIDEMLWEIHESNSGRERKVYDIKNNGICLLISYLLEIIQQKFK